MKIVIKSGPIKPVGIGKGIRVVFLLAIILSGCHDFQDEAVNLKRSNTGTEEEKKMIITAAEKSEPEAVTPADKPAPGNYETATFGLG